MFWANIHILIRNIKLGPRTFNYKYINLTFTKKSNVTLIPTKVSGKEQITIKTSEEFIKQIKLYFLNKFNNINACANIIIIPHIFNSSVWFEIYFGEIYHPMTFVKNSIIFNNLYNSNNTNNNKTITI